MEYLHLALILLLSYLVGSFPTSIVAGRVFFGTDIRRHGSGNAGGTNAVRVFGWPAGIAVILLDIAKGVVAVVLVARLPVFGEMGTPLLPADVTALVAGCVAVVGHIWTVFASFRGGKGVATAAGMVAALYPVAFAVTLPLFVLAVALSGIVSVGSLTAAVVFAISVFALDATGAAIASPLLRWVALAIALLIIYTHRSNIARLARGEEKRIFGRR